MPLTDAQRNALPAMRVMYSNVPVPLGTAESVEQRARLPGPGALPPDVSVHVEIAPPSTHPHPDLANAGCPLRVPERVPVYFYTLGTGPESDASNTTVVFFIHGGGYVLGHPTLPTFVNYYVELLRAIAQAGGTNFVLVAPSYRLATVPENAFPGALQDVVAAYDYVLGKGYSPANVTIAGDSAGGNLAVVLTHLVLQSGGAPPHGVVAIAPSSMASPGHMSERAKTLAATTDIIDTPIGEKMSTAYIGDSGMSRTHPLVAGAFLPFSARWPKTLLFVGTGDQLIDGSREIKRRLEDLGRPVELVEYDERPHGWWVMPHLFQDDIKDSVQKIAQFVPRQ